MYTCSLLHFPKQNHCYCIM